MANQIATMFSAYSAANAIERVRDHLVKFCEPSMRRN